MILYLLCIGQLTVFTCLCHPRSCALSHRSMHGTPPVPTYNILSMLYRLGKSLLTTCQLSAPSFAWVVNIGICLCYALAVLITRVDVYQSYYFVKYKALFMTRMTGMTRNMKTSSDSETANKVSEKLSFLSLLS